MKLPFHVFNIISLLLPARSHRCRHWLLRCCGASLGRGVALGGAVKAYGAFLSIGDETWVSSETIFYASAASPVVIGSRCDIGHGVHFVTGSHSRGGAGRRAGDGHSLPIHVGNGSWIGARATVLGGARIGSGTVVGAGAVVLPGEYPDNVLLAGVPAVVKKQL